MWGRLSEFVQEKLDTSAAEDEKSSNETVCTFVFHACSFVAGLILLILVQVMTSALTFVSIFFREMPKPP